MRGSESESESDVYRRQILTSKVGPRTERVNEQCNSQSSRYDADIHIMYTYASFYCICIMWSKNEPLFNSWHKNKQLFIDWSFMKWNESGFRPPLCTYRLNWARRTSWGWWDDWDDTVLQTQDSKFEPWRSEAEHATSRSRRLPTILTFTRGWGRNIFVSFKSPRPGTEPRTLAWKAAVLTTTLGPPPLIIHTVLVWHH